MNHIQKKLLAVKTQLPASVTLVAISKTKPNEAIMEAYACGQKIFGENKVQELIAKHEALPKDIQWHMVGHLQTNKVKFIASFISLIHSVDSQKLLEEINKQGAKMNRKVPVLLQVFIAKEESKFGLDEVELTNICEHIHQFQHVEFCGLMGMATNTEDKEVIRKEFKSLRILFTKIKNQYFPSNTSFKEISMGMSGDYHLAIEEGSTMVRVGSSIFGERS